MSRRIPHICERQTHFDQSLDVFREGQLLQTFSAIIGLPDVLVGSSMVATFTDFGAQSAIVGLCPISRARVPMANGVRHHQDFHDTTRLIGAFVIVANHRLRHPAVNAIENLLDRLNLAPSKSASATG